GPRRTGGATAAAGGGLNGRSRAECERGRGKMPAVSQPRQALAGVTVLDLATYLAAPVCATLLGEFGADVIKVEQPRVGDDLRRLGRPVTPSANGSYWWFVEARNKKS